MYCIHLPLGARIEIAGKTFVYQGDGTCVGDSEVLLIEGTLAPNQFNPDTRLTFRCDRLDNGEHALADKCRVAYLANLSSAA